ncbi:MULTISPECIES: hypothetical protein [Psychrobacter]|jgi:hypothetical protein|uniref:Uncharacterized protein n=2 Tax=Psychrobacter TaxID=497 RepID=A0A1G7B6D0_9GAMM|nr:MULTISPECIES: hypothetical protein [Psychrobacter]AOY44476.1 hypothetical protein AOT82_2097 [Psychrobacter sp. AntiMn-1]GLR29021.1 hypothetical protein GCM10007915_12590 [Psychrobacter pacificensis]SDE21846.1 hypothetical protein SAMN05660405_02709 [Psychrobacter pacificensis]|tara:strand:- start:587 stop:1366 length:780 start_codon:yes stop_codon:yes gene_type:complete
MESSLDEFTGRIENTIRNSISEITGHEWNEDFITLKLLSDLRRELDGMYFTSNDRKNKIDWQIYKLKGNFENNFGDIALVININYKDGTDLHGAAFLEAKKRDWRKASFSAMKIPQAKKILKNAPRSQYLLYDYEEITNFVLGSSYQEALRQYPYHRGSQISFSAVTRAVCVPLNLALETGGKDTLLYRYGTPFSLQLAKRYFNGLDLEFDETSKKVATGFLDKFGLPKYIIKINIIENGVEPKENELRVNQANYNRID